MQLQEHAFFPEDDEIEFEFRHRLCLYKQRWLSDIAHNLRTPLTIIASASAMIEGEENSEMVDLMRTSVAQADSLLQNRMDLAQVEAGEPICLGLRVHDMKDVCERAIQEQRILYQGHSHFSLKTPDNHCSANVDAGAIHRILQNLMSNAARYGDRSRGVRLILSQSEDEVYIEVHNWGRALGPEERLRMNHLFMNHGKGSDKTEADALASFRSIKENGWGNGLSIVRHLAAAHGGKVEVESSESEGTTFRVFLLVNGPE